MQDSTDKGKVSSRSIHPHDNAYITYTPPPSGLHTREEWGFCWEILIRMEKGR